MRKAVLAVVALAFARISAQAQDSIHVTPDNFVRAETDMYFGNFVKDGSLGKFVHARESASIEHQTVVRMNRDTLYSSAIFDLDAGPVTITMPNGGTRFMSVQVLDEDQYTHQVSYRAGGYTIAKKEIGTRCMAALVRILVDPNDPEDIKKVHALQDAISVKQSSVGKFEAPNWDEASQAKVRNGLKLIASTMTDIKRAFGTKKDVDPVHRLIGAAAGWGGNPDKDAAYTSNTPTKNDGTTVYKQVKGVPVDGFWSISVYNAEGFSSRTHTMPTRSTTSPRSRMPMARSRCDSAAATARSRTACQ